MSTKVIVHSYSHLSIAEGRVSLQFNRVQCKGGDPRRVKSPCKQIWKDARVSCWPRIVDLTPP